MAVPFVEALPSFDPSEFFPATAGYVDFAQPAWFKNCISLGLKLTDFHHKDQVKSVKPRVQCLPNLALKL